MIMSRLKWVYFGQLITSYNWAACSCREPVCSFAKNGGVIDININIDYFPCMYIYIYIYIYI